ncbi:MAG: glycosyltransferase [Chitinophagaceae bacterium]
MNRIIYFTKYTDAGPTSRYRVYQYKSYLENNGFNVTIKPLFPTQYILDLYGKGKKNWLILLPKYIQRFFQILFLKNYDILYIEYELFPYAPIIFEKIALIGKKNIVIDYDDATFHTYDKSSHKLIRFLLGNKIYQLVKKASVVITGSPYLTEQLQKFNANIIEIPTSICFEKYQKENTAKNDISNTFNIGWLGSKNTSVNVLPLKQVFIELQKKHSIELLLVGFDKNLLPQLNGVNYKYIQWNANTEVETIASFNVGIMPLEDKFFNYGKCGFKLIQYMACGVPTISTPLPANLKINRDNNNLFATSNDEWFASFEKMIEEKEYFKTIVGGKNKKIVEKYYCIETNSKLYLDCFNKVVRKEFKG